MLLKLGFLFVLILFLLIFGIVAMVFLFIRKRFRRWHHMRYAVPHSHFSWDDYDRDGDDYGGRD
ncbi:hypothetical protein [Pelotomaculum sp. PtaB.Bin117]|nr:hypothetical protein [Pelotomaculum sp. PtaB.Bin117]OPX87545.1 MAG: hypothetical protein A4E54_01608 [Pelotomaculum sp. PtaB.Bin117]OPY60795.1 MAG: hypothetical protein A4E56_02479 [Pelotomaculum sp. PtaU1.Bin065]